MSLYAFAGPDYQREAGRAGLLSAALLSRGPELMRLFNGAGLVAFGHGAGPAVAVKPMLLVDPSTFDQPLPPEGFISTIPLAEIRRLPAYRHLRDAVLGFGEGSGDWFDEVALWLMPGPTAYAVPGDWLTQSSLGTLGFPVVLAGGHGGYLTAGHVVTQGGGMVMDAGRVAFANVIHSLAPQGQGAAPQRDVALISPVAGLAIPSPFSRQPVSPQALDWLQVHAAQAGFQDQVRGYTTFYYSAQIGGTWGECYLLSGGRSRPGHSGAPVTMMGGVDPVGMLVAGSAGYADLVQTIGYQLSGLQGAGFAGLGLQ